MKKKIVLLVFAILFIPAVLSIEKELLKSATVYSGEIVNVSNKEFRFYIGVSEISVTLPSGFGTIIEKGSCEMKEEYYICFKEKEFWYHNYTTDKEVYKAKIEIYSIIPATAKLELTRTMAKDNLVLGEQLEIQSIIKNVGGEAAESVIYSEAVPSNFDIIYTSDGLIEQSASGSKIIKWQGNLLSGNEKKIVYMLKSLKSGSADINASANYYDGNETKTTNFKSSSITILEHQLQMNASLGKEKITVNEDFGINFTLKNIHTEQSLYANLIVKIPNGLKVLSYSLFNENHGEYLWQGNLLKQDSKTLTMNLRGIYAGDYVIDTETSFTLNSIRTVLKKNISIKVISTNLAADYLIDKDPVKSSDNVNIAIMLRNPSTKDTYEDIDVLIESQIPGLEKISKRVDKILPSESKTLASVLFKAPETETSIDYPIKVTAKYRQNLGRTTTLRDEKIIKVLGKNEIPEPVVQETAKEEVVEQQTPVEVTSETKEEQNLEAAYNETQKKKNEKEETVVKKKSKTFVYTAGIILFFIASVGVTIFYIKKQILKF